MAKIEVNCGSCSGALCTYKVFVDGTLMLKMKQNSSKFIDGLTDGLHTIQFKDSGMFKKSEIIELNLMDNKITKVFVDTGNWSYKIDVVENQKPYLETAGMISDKSIEINRNDILQNYKEDEEQNDELTKEKRKIEETNDGKKIIKNNNIEYVTSKYFFSSVFKGFFLLGLLISFVLCLIIAIQDDNSTILEVGLIVGAIISLIIAAIVNGVNRQNWNNKVNFLIEKRNLTIEELVKNYKLSLTMLTIDGKGICIDEQNKKVIVCNECDNIQVIDFDSILSYELRENGNQVIKGKGLETYAAGQLLGQNAALAMASSSRNINTFCSKLVIYIYLKDIENDNLKIELVENYNLNKNSETYSVLYNFAKDLIVNLDKIIHIKDEKIGTNKRELTQKENNIDSFEELKKLKELLDSNIITQEEFDIKKKEILKINK